MTAQSDSWPELRYEDYKETRDTLHMTAQIAGKIRSGAHAAACPVGPRPAALKPGRSHDGAALGR